jgi:SchA/CurD like domain
MSRWHALLYKLKPGHEGKVAELIERTERPAHDVIDDDGNVVGRLLTTMVFVGDETAVRIIEYEGELPVVARHMGRQPEVAAFERAVEEHLSEPRDVRSPEGAQEFFRKRGLRPVIIRRHDD